MSDQEFKESFDKIHKHINALGWAVVVHVVSIMILMLVLFCLSLSK